MESYQHNQVKQALGAALSRLGRRENLGLYFMDGYRLVMPRSHVQYEPDGCFVRYGSIGKRIVFQHGSRQTFTGLNGVPDVIVEIASLSRLDADYHVKQSAYAQLQVPEFWLLMPRGPTYELVILKLQKQPLGYVPTSGPQERWAYSPTFRRHFCLLCSPSVHPNLCVYELRSKRYAIPTSPGSPSAPGSFRCPIGRFDFRHRRHLRRLRAKGQ